MVTVADAFNSHHPIHTMFIAGYSIFFWLALAAFGNWWMTFRSMFVVLVAVDVSIYRGLGVHLKYSTCSTGWKFSEQSVD